MERFIENAMYASRWLLAPIYFGLSLGLLALALKFSRKSSTSSLTCSRWQSRI